MAFNLRTFPEIVGEMINRAVAVTPLTDINFNSVLSMLFEAAAQEDDEQYFQMLEIIRGYSLDTTGGQDLDDRAYEYGLTRNSAQFASTFVTIGDSAITKISTGVYSGLSGAAAGSLSINGDSATGFPVSGSIIVGRGTPNVETVSYSSITDNGNYVVFNLTSAFANDHGTDETIILSQGGNRLVPSGTTVMVPASDLSAQINFTLTSAATILDGEEEVLEIPVVANLAGSNANVPIGSISQFDSLPFATATVTNPQRVTNGADEEGDPELRDRIKAHIQSLSRGTGKSIITGVIGVLSDAENKRVISASLIEPTVPADVVKLFIDDGTGFIPTFDHVGYEVIVQSATGGEKYLNTTNFPLVKAFVETQLSEPYNITIGQELFVEVGGKVETITFVIGDFAVSGSVTAQEVLEKINSSASAFEARLSSGGEKVRIFARSNTDEQIRVTGGSANASLMFPTDTKYTTKLYLKRNNEVTLLSKDGTTASLESGNAEGYDFSGLTHHLCLIVDGKYNNPIHFFTLPSDFVNPSSVTAQELIGLMNDELCGITAVTSSNDTKVTISSNTKRDSSSKIRVIGDFDAVYTYNGVFTDITSEAITNASNVQFFQADGNSIYLGHADVLFQTAHFNIGIPASSPVVFNAEFWNGAAWEALGVYDSTAGFTQTGSFEFRVAHTWTKQSVNGSVPMYWIRLTRNHPAAITPPTESRIRISSMNEILNFSQLEVVGTNKDYTINRFIGQIELENPLQTFDELSLGSYDTRASVVSTSATFALVGGEILNLEIDGVSQSVTFLVSDFFDPGFATAAEVAARLNASLTGITASVIDSGTKVKMISNKFSGTLKIIGGSANIMLQFSTDLKTSLVSHIPSLESGNPEPYVFNPSSTVICVIDNNAANTFTIPCFKESTLTAVNSLVSMEDTIIDDTFPNASDLIGYDFMITSKYYSDIQDIQYISDNVNRAFISIQYVGGGTAGAEVVTVTGAVIVIQIEDGVSTATQIKAAFDGNVNATNLASATITGVGANPQNITAAIFLAAPRSSITNYVPATGIITLLTNLPFLPVLGDKYQVAPVDAAGIVKLWKNKQVTLLSTKSEAATSSGGVKVQIASLLAGDEASVQITGGSGNSVLSFPVTTVIGVDGYRYFTGLLQQAQWTVDGREDDQENYPGIRAAGVQVEVAEPVRAPIRVELNVTTGEGISLSSITNDIKSAISSYINNLDVGKDVIVSELTVAAKAVSGVFDVSVVSPIDNIAIADNELARISDSDIIIG